MLTATGNLLMADANATPATSGTHYQFVGFSTSISDSFSSSKENPIGCAWDGTNLLSTDATDAETGISRDIIKYVGFTATVDDSYTLAILTLNGCTWDGSNLITCEALGNVRLHAGFSDTVTTTISHPDVPLGVDWDGVNLLVNTFNALTVYKHDGFSETILDTFAANSPASSTGLCWDGANVITSERSTNTVTRYYGFSETITEVLDVDSFTTQVEDLAWDERWTSAPARRARGTAARRRHR